VNTGFSVIASSQLDTLLLSPVPPEASLTRLAAFLAWSTQAGSPDAVQKALAVMKHKLGEHGFDYYDWNENQSVNRTSARRSAMSC
jgi:hypothetical protein